MGWKLVKLELDLDMGAESRQELALRTTQRLQELAYRLDGGRPHTRLVHAFESQREQLRVAQEGITAQLLDKTLPLQGKDGFVDEESMRCELAKEPHVHTITLETRYMNLRLASAQSHSERVGARRIRVNQCDSNAAKITSCASERKANAPH